MKCIVAKNVLTLPIVSVYVGYRNVPAYVHGGLVLQAKGKSQPLHVSGRTLEYTSTPYIYMCQGELWRTLVHPIFTCVRENSRVH